VTRILLISPYFPPQHSVASLRTHEFARTWAACGASVTVLTTTKRDDQRGLDLPPDGFDVAEVEHPTPWLLDSLRTAEKSAPAGGDDDGGDATGSLIRVLRGIRTRTGVFSSIRMPDLTDAWVEPAVAWAREHGPWDVIVSSSGPYTAHLVALALTRARARGLTRACARGRPRLWVADFRDLWTENHVGRGLFPFTVRERALQAQCFDAADMIVTVSPGLADRLRSASSKPVDVIYNGFSNDAEAAGDETDGERAFPKDDRIRLAYTGTLYPPDQDPSPLLQGMARARDRHPDVAARLRLVIAGHRASLWKPFIAAHRIGPMVEMHGLLPRPHALRIQREAGALLSIQWSADDDAKASVAAGVLSGKIFEYLPRRAPILVIGGTAAGPIAAMVRETGRGLHLGSDVEVISATLCRLVKGDATLGLVRNQDAVGAYRRERQSERLYTMIEDRLAGSAPGVSGPTATPTSSGARDA